jgi:hypothetical protein
MEWKESQANRTSDEAKTKYTVDGNVEIANVQADASVKVARIQAAGVIAETATKHVCNLGGQVEGNGKINTETLAHVRRHDTKGDPLPADSHENCEATLFYSLEVIGGEPVTTENTRRPRFKAHEVVPAREKQTTAPAAPASGASAPTPPGQ